MYRLTAPSAIKQLRDAVMTYENRLFFNPTTDCKRSPQTQEQLGPTVSLVICVYEVGAVIT